MSVGEIPAAPSSTLRCPTKNPDAMWTFNAGRRTPGVLPPPLIKMRYGEPAVVRVYNNLPEDRTRNGGFGRNEIAIHNHNAHNASASDGAPIRTSSRVSSTTITGAPVWPATTRSTRRHRPRASGPDDNEGLNHVQGDFRELQGTLWFHDHRFFFTAENVYKGVAGALNYYSGPDRGHEGARRRCEPPAAERYAAALGQHRLRRQPDDRRHGLRPERSDVLRHLRHRRFRGRSDARQLSRTTRSWKCCRASTGSGSSTCACRAFSSSPSPMRAASRCRSSSSPTTATSCTGRLRRTTWRNKAPRSAIDVVVDFSRFAIGDTITLVNRIEHEDGRGPERSYGCAGRCEAYRGSGGWRRDAVQGGV